ncbi:hypothetical protein PMAYCL1PPCAC_10937, partial [Pristionchus mayeri]
RCQIYHTSFGFEKSPASTEEVDFPLAYGVLAHERFEQLLLTLSSVYELHNHYCVAVPSNADQSFIHLVHGLADCFENIHVLQTGPILWGAYEILRATFDCMEYLYLSGVDAPLRTNLEMVKIFKEWNGLSHVEAVPYNGTRLRAMRNKTPPLPIFKSSLSGVIAREAAKVMIFNANARKLLEFLRPTHIADEAFWASTLGNPDILPIPGGFNATEFSTFQIRYSETTNSSKTIHSCIYPPCLSYGFVGRFQIWDIKRCKGLWKNKSCVFGVRHLPQLSSNAALVAHKLYIDYEPAAFICMLKRTAHRRAHPDANFDARQYNSLPQIEFARGATYEQLSRPDLFV